MVSLRASISTSAPSRGSMRRLRPPCCTPGRPASRRWRSAPPARGDADGGVFVLTIPQAPYRCPPGSVRAGLPGRPLLQDAQTASKVLVLDANPEIMSKKGLFTKAFNEHYGGIVEYRPNSNVTRDRCAQPHRDHRAGRAVRADVLNVVPPQAAATLARKAGLVNANNRWCQVDWVTMESTAAPGCARAGRRHVLGAGHAQVGPHGQPARQDGGRGHRRDCWAAVCRSPR
jgi:hypothetical protein